VSRDCEEGRPSGDTGVSGVVCLGVGGSAVAAGTPTAGIEGPGAGGAITRRKDLNWREAEKTAKEECTRSGLEHM